MASTKRHNVPGYAKNLKRSAAKMGRDIAFTTMPSLANTVVSTKQVFTDLRQFAVKERSRLRIQNNYQKKSLLRPVHEIIENAKDDLKSGKFYNEERLAESQTQNMSEFLGTMSGDEDYAPESNSEVSLASFNKFISSTSANSMSTARAISDTQIKTTEYLGELSMTQHTQNMVMNRQMHLEQMGKLNNLEKIGMSMVEFNTKTMTDHIKATHQFYDEILSETRDLKRSIDKIANSMNARYGDGKTKMGKKNALADIFGGGSFDISSYFGAVKGNISNQIPFTGDMMKGMFDSFKASPISGLMTLASTFMMPKGVKSGAGKMDKTIQGLFAQYLHMMNDWKYGRTKHNGFLGDLEQLIGNIAGVDMRTNAKPDLSQYKNQALTAEMELKKHKAITEVIPSYLSEILKTMSGKDMFFNYTKGMFEDRDTVRSKLDKDKKSSLVYSMDETKRHFDRAVDSVSKQFSFDNNTKKSLEEDIDTFIAWLATSDYPYEPQKNRKNTNYYSTLVKQGLNLKGGINTYKIIESMYLKSSSAKRLAMTSERVSANVVSKDIMQKFNSDLQSAGTSALYNGLSDPKKEDRSKIRFGAKFSDIESYISSLRDLTIEEEEIYKREYEAKKRRELGLDSENDTGAKLKNRARSMATGKLDKFGVASFFKSVKETTSKLSDEIDSKLSMVANKLAEGSERILYGDSDDGYSGFEFTEDSETMSSSPVKAKAIKVANKVRNKTYGSHKPIRIKARPVFATAGASSSTDMARNLVENSIDYRPYFETIDSHLRNIATIISQDKTLQVSQSSDGSVISGIMSGASKKLQSLYGVGRQRASDTWNSLKKSLGELKRNITEKTTTVGFDEKAKGIKSSAGKAAGVAKEKGLEFISRIASGISTAGGNVIGYLKSDQFKDLLSGMKDKIGNGTKSVKEFAGTLFDKMKNSSLLKKGKGMFIGGTISSMLGLGPIPGAIIGTLFSKHKKSDNSNEDNKQLDEIEKQESQGEGLLDSKKVKSKKKKKSVLAGSAISTALGLGPIPGALVTMIWNKRFAKDKAEEKDEEQDAEQLAEGVEKAEKESKGLGKGKKLKNLTVGAMASSLLGLGPMPGVIAASIYNKHKDKAAKKKDKEEQKQGEETAEMMEEATDVKKKKSGILSKIKNFFGKGKNLALGATASTLLGLGPIPGIVVASMYNKKKYKKDAKETDPVEAIKEQANVSADKELGKTGESNEAKEERKKNRKYLLHAKRVRKAEAEGNYEEAERLESQHYDRTAAKGDLEGAEKTQSLISASRNTSGGGSGSSKEKPTNPQTEGLFSKMKGLLGGGLGGILSALAAAALALLGLKNLGSGEYVDAGGNVNQGNVNGTLGGIGGFLGAKILSKLPVVGKYFKNTGAVVGTAGYAAKMAGEIKDGDTGEAVESGAYLAKNSYNLVKNTKGVKSLVKKGDKALAKTATKVAAKSGTVATKATSKLAISIAKMLKNLSKNGIVTRFAPNLAKKLGTASTKIGKWVSKILASSAKKGAKAAATTTANAVADAIPYVNIAVNAVFAIGGFINGWNNVKNILRLSPDYKPPTSLKFTSAIVAALDASLGNGLLDLFSVRDDVIEFIYKLFASDEEEAKFEEAQAKQKQGYEDFLKNNAGTTLTEEKYNNLTNKKWYSKAWDGVKKFFGGKVETLDDYKTGITVNNIDNSQNSTLMISDTSGSGGRGLANKTNSQIIKEARDRLSKNIYSNSIQRVTDQEVNQYVNSTKYSDPTKMDTTEKNSGNFFSNMGKTISNAAKWMKDKLSSAWDWLKGLFSGSGGRGNESSTSSNSITNNNYTYYSQSDPRWGNNSFGMYNGKRDTIKAGGCGPTVAAMALENLTGQQVLPSTMAKLALEAGQKYDNGGTDPSFFDTAGQAYGINFKQSPGFNNEAVNALRSGSPVPLLGKNGPYGGGSHYLLATGIDKNNRVSILDPQNKANNKKFPLKTLVNNTSSSMISNASYSARNNKYVKRVRNIGRGPHLALVTNKKAIDNIVSGRASITSDFTSINYTKSNRSKADIKYIVIHYTAAEDGKAAGSVNWFKNSENPYKTSAHYVVDANNIIQVVSDKDIAHHCGGGMQGSTGGTFYNKCTNSNSIGIEMASHLGGEHPGKYWFDAGTIDNTVQLTNMLMSKYGIPKDRVIRHYDVTGKICPAPWVKSTSGYPGSESGWSTFKNRLTGVSSIKHDVGAALVGGMAALEGKLNYSQSQRDPAKGSGDCSSTVQWVYKKVCGIDPGSTTSAMEKKGTQILASTKDSNKVIEVAKAGDLLLFSGHVEMYDGNGGCWGHGGGNDGSIPGTRHSTVSGYMSSMGACQVRRYITGNESVNANLGTIVDKDGNKVNIQISSEYISNTATSDHSGETIVQALLNSIGINKESAYAKISDEFGSILTTVNAEGTTGGSVEGSVNSNALGTKLNKDEAAKHDIRSFSSINADKLRSAINSYTKRDNSWMATQADNIIAASKATGLDPRFLVAMAAGENGWDKTGYHKNNNFFNIGAFDSDPDNAISTANNLGFNSELDGWVKGAQWIKDNYVTKYNQSSLYAMKNPTSVGAPDWHSYQTGPIDTKANIYSSLIDYTGGVGGRGNSPSILPYKVKDTIARMSPSIPDRMIYGRGGSISTSGVLNGSKRALNNKKSVKLSKELIINPRSEEIRSENLFTSTQNKESINGELLMQVLQNMLVVLNDISISNKDISNKNFSPSIAVAAPSGGGTTISNNRKSSLIDDIITGI